MVLASADNGEMDLVRALESKADEYIRLPCSSTELIVRVVGLLRHTGYSKPQGDETPLRLGDLAIFPASYEVYLNNEPLALTPMEFRLLYILAKNPRVTLSQDYIQRAVWGSHIAGHERLKKSIQRLRHKLGDRSQERKPNWIKTVPGIGYQFLMQRERQGNLNGNKGLISPGGCWGADPPPKRRGPVAGA